LEFKHLIGHDALIAHWRDLLALDRLPHVILLEGREGVGKAGLLAALTALHVCETRAACGTCGQCRALRAGLNAEVLWLDDPAGTGKLPLEVIGELQDHLSLSPAPPVRYRVAVLVDADRMTPQAANSLLKILEEPPPSARIFLSTSRPKAMLDTILSRCVKWRVAPPPVEQSLAWLTARAAEDGLTVSQDAAMAALKRAGLAPGAALRLLARDGADAELKERLGRLLAARRPDDVAREAEVLAKESGLDLAELLGAIERELNERYARGQGVEGGTTRLALRREKLRELKALAIQARLPLSPALSLESLALSGI
jgi:DNA polymerase-3 subunit delta'